MDRGVLHLGVIGTADIAVSRVIPGLKKSRKVYIKAIASRDVEKSKRWAQKLEIDDFYGSYQEMLESAEVDAVYIPLPNSLHSEWSIKSLQMGKHVMCEKPLAVTSEEARRMIKVAREKNLVLMEGFMYRFHPRNKVVLEMVKNGEIGEVKAIESSFSYVLDNYESYLMNRELGGGALYDVGCYCVHVSRMLTGAEPGEVYGTCNLSKTKVDVSFSGILRFAGCVISSFHVSMNEEPRFYYRVVGDKGLIEVPWAFVSFGKETHIILQRNENQKKITFKGIDEYRLEFEHFAEAVIEKRPLLYTLEDSLKNTYVLEALSKSAKKGKPLKVSH